MPDSEYGGGGSYNSGYGTASGSSSSSSGSRSSGGNAGDIGVGGVPGGPSRSGGSQASYGGSTSSGGSAGRGGDLGVAGVPGGVNRTGGSLAGYGGSSSGSGGRGGDLGVAGVPGGVNRSGGSLASYGGSSGGGNGGGNYNSGTSGSRYGGASTQAPGAGGLVGNAAAGTVSPGQLSSSSGSTQTSNVAAKTDYGAPSPSSMAEQYGQYRSPPGSAGAAQTVAPGKTDAEVAQTVAPGKVDYGAPPSAPDGIYGPRVGIGASTGYLNDLSSLGFGPDLSSSLTANETASPYASLNGNRLSFSAMKGDMESTPTSVASLFGSPAPIGEVRTPTEINVPGGDLPVAGQRFSNMVVGGMGIQGYGEAAPYGSTPTTSYASPLTRSNDATARQQQANLYGSPSSALASAVDGVRSPFGQGLYSQGVPAEYADRHLNGEHILAVEDVPEDKPTEITIPGGDLPTGLSPYDTPYDQSPSQYDPPKTWQGKVARGVVNTVGHLLPFGLGTAANQASKYFNQGLTPGDLIQRDLDGYLNASPDQKAAYDARANARRQADWDRSGSGNSYHPVSTGNGYIPPVGAAPPPPATDPAPAPATASYQRRRIGNPADPYSYGYGPGFNYFNYS